jgi:hypothetical protein
MKKPNKKKCFIMSENLIKLFIRRNYRPRMRCQLLMAEIFDEFQSFNLAKWGRQKSTSSYNIIALTQIKDQSEVSCISKLNKHMVWYQKDSLERNWKIRWFRKKINIYGSSLSNLRNDQIFSHELQDRYDKNFHREHIPSIVFTKM